MKTQLKLKDMRCTSVVLQLLCPAQNLLSLCWWSVFPNLKSMRITVLFLELLDVMINPVYHILFILCMRMLICLSLTTYDSGKETTDNVNMDNSNCSGI